MPVMGIDFAWSKPSAADAKAAGAHWAAGYYSTDPSKNLTAALVSEYLSAGLAIVGVWETTTARATAGYAAGAYDAQEADRQRAGVGLPDTAVIHLAVDEDTDWASVEQYFAGATSVLGQHRVGVYGGIRVIAGAAAAGYKYLWQTVAWSNGQWDPHATIHQEANTLFGGNADVDYSETADFGQYPAPEVNMPLTPADAQLVADTLLDSTVVNKFRTDANGQPVKTPVNQFLIYGDHHFDVLYGEVAALSKQVAALTAIVEKLVPPAK